MALKFMTAASLSGPAISGQSMESSGGPTPLSKRSRKKFLMLLAANVIIWTFWAIYFFEIQLSLTSFKLPKYGLEVTGIIYNERNPMVLISNEEYFEGDSVQGYTIIEIRKHEVELEKDDQRIIKTTR